MTKKKSKKKETQKESPEERKAQLRKLLITKREELLKEAKEEIGRLVRGENKELVETALDDGDWSVIDLAEDLNLRKLTIHKENLNKIDEALRKIDEGTYGICEDCGTEIDEERLKVIPFAIYCVDCMEQREKLEEMER
ncbi:general stress protein 16O [bacterium BMS3Bbin06]|nr:general stress protein 16O [bacterium BMS3Abin08]GBE35398.1 general stress protein 16O [bacterium BMS3Bbin06]HDO35592.1 TraR/DksA family transcriptional regulator [Nitrospirota bacterium]HDY71585.1 TraR/DksA family transcriptional regulator [Nitrospirota bacterium]